MMRLSVLVFVVAAVSLQLDSVLSERPQVVFFHLVDDFGWNNAGWHNSNTSEVQTPNLDRLVANGIELDRAYSYLFCGPSRCSVQSGRLPVHVNTANDNPNKYNPETGASAGIPRNMTGLGEVMRQQSSSGEPGYSTHFVGKWDAGMAYPEQSPHGRGYDTALSYFHHDNDYWTETVFDCKDGNGKRVPIVDYWGTDGPAPGNGSVQYNTTGPKEAYEEEKFKNHVLGVIDAWYKDLSSKQPLFIFYASHAVHAPLQVPTPNYDVFSGVKEDWPTTPGNRRTYAAMANFVDGAVGEIVDKLVSIGVWNSTLWASQSDNGGPSFFGSSFHAANNHPLTGSKYTVLEGGLRVNAFVSGGYLNKVAPDMVGTKLDSYVHLADWYATLAELAGVDPTDHKAKAAGLPPIDSLSMWPYLSGKVPQSPRDEIYSDTNVLIKGDMKLVVGDGLVGYCNSGPIFPNSTYDPKTVCTNLLNCGETGCLFNITRDPLERQRLETDLPTVAAEMVSRLAELNQTYYDPHRGKDSPLACEYALNKYGGFWGPFVDV